MVGHTVRHYKMLERLGEAGTRARQRVLESYTIEMTAERTAKIYDEALESRSGPAPGSN